MESSKIILFCLITFLFSGASSCSNEEPTKNMWVENLQVCNPETEKIKEVSGEKGMVWFNSDINKYCIYVGIDGSYDSQIVGVLCSIPDDLKKEGVDIEFKGSFHEYNEEVRSYIHGQTYYHLSLSKFNILSLK